MIKLLRYNQEPIKLELWQIQSVFLSGNLIDVVYTDGDEPKHAKGYALVKE